LIEDEEGADSVQELLENAKRGEIVILASFMSFMEVWAGQPWRLAQREVGDALSERP